MFSQYNWIKCNQCVYTSLGPTRLCRRSPEVSLSIRLEGGESILLRLEGSVSLLCPIAVSDILLLENAIVNAL